MVKQDIIADKVVTLKEPGRKYQHTVSCRGTHTPTESYPCIYKQYAIDERLLNGKLQVAAFPVLPAVTAITPGFSHELGG